MTVVGSLKVLQPAGNKTQREEPHSWTSSVWIKTFGESGPMFEVSLAFKRNQNFLGGGSLRDSSHNKVSRMTTSKSACEVSEAPFQ